MTAGRQMMATAARHTGNTKGEKVGPKGGAAAEQKVTCDERGRE
jgi:hypothetical protein